MRQLRVAELLLIAAPIREPGFAARSSAADSAAPFAAARSEARRARRPATKGAQRGGLLFAASDLRQFGIAVLPA